MNALLSFKMTGAPIIAWLLRIAHNASVNHLKKRTRRNEVELFDTGISSGDDPWKLGQIQRFQGLRQE